MQVFYVITSSYGKGKHPTSAEDIHRYGYCRAETIAPSADRTISRGLQHIHMTASTITLKRKASIRPVLERRTGRGEICLGIQSPTTFHVRRCRKEAWEKDNAFLQTIRTRLKKAQQGTSLGRPLIPAGTLVQARDDLKKHHHLRSDLLELNRKEGPPDSIGHPCRTLRKAH